MVSSGNRRDGQPAIVNPNAASTKPKRLSFDQKIFEEKWLQKLIDSNPELLPVTEIEPAFAPLVSVGLEIETGVGFIDNLFISPQGYLTMAETKLWRNHEARREVVSQIIDYAAAVSHWTFEQLESKVRDYNKQYRGSDLGILDSLRLIQI